MLAQALETFIPGRGRSRWMWRRNCLCISLCLYAGLRIEEVRSLAWELNIDLAMQTINVIGKGEKPREVPIPSILFKEIEQIPPHERKGAVIGLRNGAHLDERSIGKIFGRWLPSIGVEGVTAHRLRHTYAKELLDQGVALEVIQALLGHEDPETTLIYVGGPSIERLRKSVECLQEMTKMRRRKRVEIASY